MEAIPSFEYLNDPFRETEESAGFGSVPDGDYRSTVDAVEIKESNNNPGSFYLNWTLKIVGPEQSGRILFHTNNLPDASTDMDKARQQLGFLKHDLACCGVNIKHPQFNLNDFLHNHLAKLLDRPMMVQAKTRKDKRTGEDRQNTYFLETKAGASGNAGALAPMEVPAATEDAFDPLGQE